MNWLPLLLFDFAIIWTNANHPTVSLQHARNSLKNWFLSTGSSHSSHTVQHVVEHSVENLDGAKAAQYLSQRWFASKSRASEACKQGLVLSNGGKIYGTKKLQSGDLLEITFPANLQPQLSEKNLMRLVNYTNNLLSEAQNPPAHVLFEDDDLAVMYKPSGVHSLRWIGTMQKNIYAFDDTLPLLLKPPQLRGEIYDTVSATRDAHNCDNNYLTVGGEHSIGRPIPCHRLDARVSGCILVAKTRRSRVHLGNQFEQHTVKKEYRAILVGYPRFDSSNEFVTEDNAWDSIVSNTREFQRWQPQYAQQVQPGVEDATSDSLNEVRDAHSHKYNHNDALIDDPLVECTARGWKPENISLRITSDLNGRLSTTVLRVLDVTPCPIYGSLTTVALFPLTGRRHQLRKHCTLLGCPILGDTLYHDAAYYATAKQRLLAVDILSGSIDEGEAGDEEDESSAVLPSLDNEAAETTSTPSHKDLSGGMCGGNEVVEATRADNCNSDDEVCSDAGTHNRSDNHHDDAVKTIVRASMGDGITNKHEDDPDNFDNPREAKLPQLSREQQQVVLKLGLPQDHVPVRLHIGLYLTALGIELEHPNPQPGVESRMLRVRCAESARFERVRVKARKGWEWNNPGEEYSSS